MPMLTLPPAMLTLLAPFAPLFRRRVWPYALVLVVGTLLAPGKRTVTAALRVLGLEHTRRFERYHRVLNRAQWSSLGLSRVLLRLLVAAFAPTGPLLLGVDETLERRRGKRIPAKGIYRDPVRSSHEHFVKASGLRWICLMLLVPIPWAGRVWALPFLTALAPSERYIRSAAGATRPWPIGRASCSCWCGAGGPTGPSSRWRTVAMPRWSCSPLARHGPSRSRSSHACASTPPSTSRPNRVVPIRSAAPASRASAY